MTGSVISCLTLFSTTEFLFSMPAIQRPYDWEADDARLLLDDLFAAIGNETDVRCVLFEQRCRTRPTEPKSVCCVSSLGLAPMLLYCAHLLPLSAATQLLKPRRLPPNRAPALPLPLFSSLDPFLLGPINLATGPPVGNHPDLRYKYVLDGQQRIVTLCLLFAAARERFRESEDSEHLELADSITAYLKQVRRHTQLQRPLYFFVWSDWLAARIGSRSQLQPCMAFRRPCMPL